MLYEVHSLFLLTFNIVFHQLVDGESVTTMRTAAASAVALKVVSFSLLFCTFPFFFLMQVLKSGTPKILCIVGTGAQARSHAEAFKLICQFEEVPT